MNTLITCVFVLLQLLVPVSSEGDLLNSLMCLEPFFNDTVICYFLDIILMVYCITFTAFYFREKLSYIQSKAVAVEMSEIDGGIYQELERPKEADAYEVLEPSKRKKRAAKKKNIESPRAEQRDMDPFESMIPSSSAPPLSPR